MIYQNTHSYLLYFPRKQPWKCVTVGPGRFIVLNYSASPKMVIKMNLNFFSDFLKGFRAVWMSSRRPIYDCWLELRSIRSLVNMIQNRTQLSCNVHHNSFFHTILLFIFVNRTWNKIRSNFALYNRLSKSNSFKYWFFPFSQFLYPSLLWELVDFRYVVWTMEFYIVMHHKSTSPHFLTRGIYLLVSYPNFLVFLIVWEFTEFFS